MINLCSIFLPVNAYAGAKLKAVNKTAIKQGRKVVLRTVAGNSRRIVDIIGRHGWGDCSYEHRRTDNIHVSHDIKPIKNDSYGVYCDRCGALYTGGPLKKLQEECPCRIQKARSFQHRLLQLGIVPHKGAKVPQHNGKKWTRRPV